VKVALCLVILAAACSRPAPPPQDAGAIGQAVTPTAPPDAAVAGQDARADVLLAGGPVRPEPPERDPDAPRVRLKLTVLPVDAEVAWGRKKLGVAGRKPLELERPRGSGPLDLVLQAPGFLPFHTRMHTDRDDALVVRLVRPQEARSLLGWSPPADPGSARR
jgi:hypothetical protein